MSLPHRAGERSIIAAASLYNVECRELSGTRHGYRWRTYCDLSRAPVGRDELLVQRRRPRSVGRRMRVGSRSRDFAHW